MFFNYPYRDSKLAISVSFTLFSKRVTLVQLPVKNPERSESCRELAEKIISLVFYSVPSPAKLTQGRNSSEKTADSSLKRMVARGGLEPTIC